MIKNKIIIIIILFLFSFHGIAFSSIKNGIIANVGTEIITNADLENKIRTVLSLNGQAINQKNINDLKNNALKGIIRTIIKRGQINKYKVTEYNNKDVENHLNKVANLLSLPDGNSIKYFFEQNNINYDIWINELKTDLLWNTLIYRMYNSQISINPIEIENDLKKLIENNQETKEYNLSELVINNLTENKEEIIEKIYKLIEEKGFKEAVNIFSISDSRSNKGELGWVNEASLSEIFLNNLKSISKNKTTVPIEMQENLIILKINEIRKMKTKTVNIEELKKNIINKKKQDKLNLFSRSHFSKIENSTLINLR